MELRSYLRVCTVRQRLLGMLTSKECYWLSQNNFTSKLFISSSSSSSSSSSLSSSELPFSGEGESVKSNIKKVDEVVVDKQIKNLARKMESQWQIKSLEEEAEQEHSSSSSSPFATSQSVACEHQACSRERNNSKREQESNAIKKRMLQSQLEKEAVSKRLRCLFEKQPPAQIASEKRENSYKVLPQENECKFFQNSSTLQFSNKEEKESLPTTSIHSELHSEDGYTSTYHKQYSNMFNIDEDEHEKETNLQRSPVKRLSKSNRISVEVLEEELIDDNYAYLSEITSQEFRNKMLNGGDVNGVVTPGKSTNCENVHKATSVKKEDYQENKNKNEMLSNSENIDDSRTLITHREQSCELSQTEREILQCQEQQQKQLQNVWTEKITYVPGQQIIEPGLTRYRLEVQYQGCDFDGWHKSTKRKLLRRTLSEDGNVRYEEIQSNGNILSSNLEPTISNAMTDEMSVKYCVKTVLEEALSIALDVAKVNVVASVIPETGVSVRRLTCHVDIPSEIEMQPRTILQRATMWLEQRRQPLAILSFIRCVNQDFHARFSCTRRIYCYRILNRIAPPLFDAGLQWHVDRYLNIHRMKRFAELMTGTHDYGYFTDPKMANALRRTALSVPGRLRTASIDEHYTPSVLGLRVGEQLTASKETFEKGLSNLQRARALPTFNEYGQKVVSYDAKSKNYYRAATNLPTVRTIDSIDIVRQDDEIIIWFVGQSFLRHQIRNMVSVLKAVGNGLWDEHELQYALNSGFTTSRNKFSRERLPPAPVHGLTLWDVEYSRKHQDDKVAFVHSGPLEEVTASNITLN